MHAEKEGSPLFLSTPAVSRLHSSVPGLVRPLPRCASDPRRCSVGSMPLSAPGRKIEDQLNYLHTKSRCGSDREIRKRDQVWDQPRDAMSVSKHLEVPSHIKPGVYVGLRNQGSTCYFNSLLQCLFFTPELREAICSCGNSGTSIVHILIKLFQELMDRNTLLNTTGITKCLGIHNVHQQQDIEEYFRRLMDKIIEEKEEIRQLYEVKKVHTITCCECRLQTKVENPVLSLSLSFKNLASNHAGYSVASALDEIQQENTFTGDDQLYCEKCRCKQDATSKYCFGSLPQILVLHLKRYQFDSFTGFTKLSCEVSVPLLLNMSKEDHTVVYYHLYAMCHHSGGIHGGHYLAEIKSFENNSWYEFNDSRVRKIPKRQISTDGRICVSRTAYLLMYRRCVDCSAEPMSSRDHSTNEWVRAAQQQDHESEKQKKKRRSRNPIQNNNQRKSTSCTLCCISPQWTLD
ncbi:ubiquitin carboxyl-terminal hydrolase 47-like isoform X2 [Alligator sinensis]|uniref:Ubiquitin carboxyl-terminal hydrolase n=1 Tax=Alligator sinensis TaxID=38654 RepID=A0A1U8DIU3_ALLSI|nr:ubiquitin carboxyl-terminal hydrolase 47-like isoform X2 [Alligator sinensis]